jgi:hypothetical protein
MFAGFMTGVCGYVSTRRGSMCATRSNIVNWGVDLTQLCSICYAAE